MAKKLAVIPELCSGCRICELACSIHHFGVNNPKKSAVRVLVTYPQPVVRMPIVCSQCKIPVCADACPVGALTRSGGVVHLDKSVCISCMKCVEACPFGAMFAHEEIDNPIKCDLCGSEGGAENAAILFSLVVSCKLHDVDPFAYFRDVLMRVGTHPAALVHQLTPREWKARFAAAAQTPNDQAA